MKSAWGRWPRVAARLLIEEWALWWRRWRGSQLLLQRLELRTGCACVRPPAIRFWCRKKPVTHALAARRARLLFYLCAALPAAPCGWRPPRARSIHRDVRGGSSRPRDRHRPLILRRAVLRGVSERGTLVKGNSVRLLTPHLEGVVPLGRSHGRPATVALPILECLHVSPVEGIARLR